MGRPYDLLPKKEINKSYSMFYFQIHNNGDEPIANFKLLFEINGKIQHLDLSNETKSYFDINPRTFSNVVLDKQLKSGNITPKKTILVGEDSFDSDEIFVKPYPEDYEIEVKWKLISNDFKDEGVLKLIVKSDIKRIRDVIIVKDSIEIRNEEGEIEDFITEEK